MKSLNYVNQMGGTKIDLRTWAGKQLLRRIALMPHMEIPEGMNVNPKLGFLSIRDYCNFLEYPEEHLQ